MKHGLDMVSWTAPHNNGNNSESFVPNWAWRNNYCVAYLLIDFEPATDSSSLCKQRYCGSKRAKVMSDEGFARLLYRISWTGSKRRCVTHDDLLLEVSLSIDIHYPFLRRVGSTQSASQQRVCRVRTCGSAIQPTDFCPADNVWVLILSLFVRTGRNPCDRYWQGRLVAGRQAGRQANKAINVGQCRSDSATWAIPFLMIALQSNWNSPPIPSVGY